MSIAEAEKQGKIKLLRWLNSFCTDKKHHYKSFVLMKDCITCWQSKLKEFRLEEKT